MSALIIPAVVGVAGAASVALYLRNKQQEEARLGPSTKTVVNVEGKGSTAPSSQTTPSPTGAAPYLVEEGIEVRGYVSDRVTRDGRVIPHWGQDIGAPIGTPIYAVKAGTVHRAAPRGGYGNCLEIAHADGLQSSVYGHTSRFLVTEGQHVQAGQPVALVGRTSAGPDGIIPAWGPQMGPHVHFEIHNSPVPVFGEHTFRPDPTIWLRNNHVAFYRTRRRGPFANS